MSGTGIGASLAALQPTGTPSPSWSLQTGCWTACPHAKLYYPQQFSQRETHTFSVDVNIDICILISCGGVHVEVLSRCLLTL